MRDKSPIKAALSCGVYNKPFAKSAVIMKQSGQSTHKKSQGKKYN